jgi:hypothetical protein
VTYDSGEPGCHHVRSTIAAQMCTPLGVMSAGRRAIHVPALWSPACPAPACAATGKSCTVRTVDMPTCFHTAISATKPLKHVPGSHMGSTADAVQLPAAGGNVMPNGRRCADRDASPICSCWRLHAVLSSRVIVRPRGDATLSNHPDGAGSILHFWHKSILGTTSGRNQKLSCWDGDKYLS